MKNKVFIDTNILVYMQSGLDPSKTKISRQLFETCASQNLIVLSTQILQEFYVTMTRKLGHDPVTIKKLLSLFTDFEIIMNTPGNIFEAIDISVLHQLSFRDSLICSAAISGNCKYIYSEDLHHGLVIRGVEVVNPFKEQRI